jgi:serine/threonine protein kinase
MGVVYLAFGPDNAPVALKVLQPFLAEDDEYRTRFIREVRAARLVDSPYVAKVKAAETESSPLWMAIEYIEGATLAHAVESNGPVPAERLRGLALGLANAIMAMHDVGLVHRDLKPANVVLAWSGPKLIDFGIAKREGSTDLTQTGVAVGSVVWMSPEVISDGHAGRASDIFGWGLCVAAAGTGRPPFGAGDTNSVAFRILSGEPDLQGLPPEMAGLVSAALAKDPQSRPTAEELAGALRSPGAIAPPPAAAVPRSDGGWTGPKPTTVAAPPWTGHSPPVASPVEPDPPSGGRPNRRWVWPVAVLAVLLIAAAVAITLLVTSGNDKKAGPPSPSTSVTPSHSSRSTSPPSSPPSTPASLSPGNASLASAEAVVTAAGYTPSQNDGQFWDPQAPINVVLGTLTGSADGYNNWAFFFAGNSYIGHDATSPSMQIAIQGRTKTVITLAYQIYGPSDPTCCPTGGTQTVRYQWNGSKLVPLDPIPSDDPTGNHR